MVAVSTSKSSTSPSLKEYLKRYETPTSADAEAKKKKKKKKKQSKPDSMGAVRVFDEDPIWQKPVNLEDEEEDNDPAGEEKPQIDEDVEVKRMKRLEEIRSRRPYLAISDDGSGWVSVSHPSKPLNFGSEVLDTSRSGISLSEHERRSLDRDGETVDLSLPWKRRARFDTPSPEHGPQPSNSVSPDRDLSPQRRFHPRPALSDARTDDLGRHDSPDLSPPRRGHRHLPEPDRKPSDSISPSRDLSPPRRSHPQMAASDLKRKRTDRYGSPDLSPPRQSRRRSEESDPEASGRHDSPDLSPPRRGLHYSAESDLKASGRHDSPDLSAAGRGYRLKERAWKASEGHDSLDLSPPRRSRSHAASSDFKEKDLEKPKSGDLSTPRRGHRHSPEVDGSRAASVAGIPLPRGKDSSSVKEGRRSGLFNKHEFKEETDRKRKEDLLWASKMDPSTTGKGAEPVYRDKQGKRVSKDEFLKLQQGEEKPKEKKLEWGKGLAQKREAEAKEHELELEREKPFARTRDDPELDKMLMNQIRWGDPMAHLVKRKQPELVLEDFGDNEKIKESGFIIPQTIPSHSWIKRGIDPVANRYGIRPGRHWDGVDRSNGYEKDMFKRQNEKQATEREAYLWSVSDM